MSMMDLVTGNEKTNESHAVSPVPDRLKKNQRVMILTADNTEDIEFFYPYYRLTEEGYTVDIVTPEGGKFTAKHGLGLNQTKAITAVKPTDYVLLYIPGGKAPTELRKNNAVINFVKEFAASGKVIAAVCHGPQVLITAGLVNGKQMAAWPEVAKEIKDAGGIYVDEALVEDGQFITARKPGDLPRHLYGVMQYLNGNYAMQDRSQRKVSGGTY